NLVAAGVAKEVLVQVSYAIGVAKPCGVFLDTYGTSQVKGDDGKILNDGEIARKVEKIFDLRPYAIEQRLKLRFPIYSETAAYGHMGREPKKVTKVFENSGKRIEVEVELFTWEKLDFVDQVKAEFGL
ncbi:MAG: S-adenosylmethionine synthetase, partial [Arcticibacterium sp.]